ncbi:hypothetical protein [uncultured Erythrobacter sp.]|uniref:hypothetical protein n=1 Tax=uncultured Erythrobacter sp. TaxID=263913 RepID=UPI00263767C1|nr:hypothetical protein [uncultured Erythrobacter sp.]
MRDIRSIITLFAELAQSPATIRAALLILPYAGVLIGLDVAAHYGSLTDALLPVQFYLASDRSFGEFLEYGLTGAVAVMTFLLWHSERTTVYLANSVLFAFLTVDNWIELHEQFGQAAGPTLGMIEGIPVEGSHLAEASLMIGVGVFWAAALALGLRAAKGQAVVFNLALAGCVIGAAMFGVVIDLLVVWGEQGKVFHAILTFVEDAGEFAMIILALLLTVGFFDREWRQRSSAANIAQRAELTSGSAGEPRSVQPLLR